MKMHKFDSKTQLYVTKTLRFELTMAHCSKKTRAQITKLEESSKSSKTVQKPNLFSNIGFPMDPNNYFANFTPMLIPSSPVLTNLPSSPPMTTVPPNSPLVIPTNNQLPSAAATLPHSPIPNFILQNSALFTNFLNATATTTPLVMNPNALPFTPQATAKSNNEKHSKSPSVGVVEPSRSKSNEEKSMSPDVTTSANSSSTAKPNKLKKPNQKKKTRSLSRSPSKKGKKTQNKGVPEDGGLQSASSSVSPKPQVGDKKKRGRGVRSRGRNRRRRR